MLTRNDLLESRFFMVFLACLVSMGPIAIDAYLPMMPNIAGYFSTDIATVNLTMSTFLIGMGVGQFFGGSLSDQLGRKVVGIIGLTVFCITSVLIVFADSIYHVQLLRFPQAVGSGFASVICLAQVRDIYPKEQVMKRFANVVLVVLLAPLLAPLLGALLAPFGWQSIFLLLALFSFLALFSYVVYIPETLNDKPKKFSIQALFSGYVRVATHRVNGQLTAIRFIIFSGCNAGIFMGFLTNSVFFYMEYFGMSELEFAGVFAAHGFMMMLGNRLAVWLSVRWTPIKTLTFINLMQILITMSLCFIAYQQWQTLTTILPFTLLSMVMNGALMPTASATFIGYFEKNVGAAASLNTTTVFIGGALIGALASWLSNGQLLPIFVVMVMAALAGRLVLSSIKDR